MTRGVRGRPPAQKGSAETTGTRDRLLVAALELFGTLGYHEANVRRISEQVGVDHALVLRHFRSKALLFAEAVNLALDEARAARGRDRPEAMQKLARLMLAAAFAPADVRQNLVAIVTARMDASDRRPANALSDESLGDAVCQQLAQLLLTLHEGETSQEVALTSRLYAHVGRSGGRRTRARAGSSSAAPDVRN